MTILNERGYFWPNSEIVPENRIFPDSAITGTVTVDEDGRIDLDLDGYFPSPKGPLSILADSNQPFEADVCIQGILKGTPTYVLIAGLMPYGGQFTSNGISHQKYRALTCIKSSAPFKSGRLRENIKSIMVSLDGLEEWIFEKNIHFRRSNKRWTAEYIPRRPYKFNIDGNIFQITNFALAPYGNISTRSLTMKENWFLSVRFKKKISTSSAKEYLGSLQDFFMLLTGQEYYLPFPNILSTNGQKCTLYFSRRWKHVDPVNWHECWVRLPEIRASIGTLLSTWMTKKETYGPTFMLYFGAQRSSGIYQEHRFVNLIWGLEALHRAQSSALPKSPSLAAKIDRIIASAPKKDKQWLRSKLKNADEPSLADRLSEMVERAAPWIPQRNIKNFSAACARNRNDISHFGSSRTHQNYSSFITDLDFKSRALSEIYHAILLLEIGIEPSIVQGFMATGRNAWSAKWTFRRAGLLDEAEE